MTVQTPPNCNSITGYDREHFAIYLRLLDAIATNVDWRVCAQQILGLDVDADASAARALFDANLARAIWMTKSGYKDLLKDDT